ncbi:hypothetical protein SAMN05421640_1321 [Ekhidna lutea]|uniref:Uncharacterized protein n=1 Tax=Ekhidna lutea TaxID=447679 RepID=A0A239HIL3_EKHLU|nr:hypothetical protein [Ekhidna lutea]SNS80888.1 hypothetical protein SAMN05421640_1321 [Ekhidna lutea]
MNRKLLYLGLIMATLTSCFDKDIFPDTPSIAFEDIKFIDTQSTDSLKLTFTFEDGNGDVGLDDGPDLLVPYQIYDLIIDSEDSVITISTDPSRISPPLFKAPVFIGENNGEVEYIFFPGDKVLFSDEDNRPPYSCDSYEIIESDTFYIARNEFYYNFHIEFQRKLGEDSYEPINFRQIFNNPDCSLGNFNGRIPYYDPEGKSGTITYSMLSQAFRLAFLDDVIRVKFYIYDRARNKSNEVVSPDFVLADITQSQ